MLEVKIKKLVAEAKAPFYATEDAAGCDLTATSKEWSDKYQCWIYGTGIAIEIPKGYVGLLFPRSSIRRYSLSLSNSIGVIDSDYRGEVMFSFRPVNAPNSPIYKVGEKIGQIIIMPYPEVKFTEVNKLSETERGEGGHGHTGN